MSQRREGWLGEEGKRRRTEKEPPSNLDSAQDGGEVETLIFNFLMQFRPISVPVGVTANVRYMAVSVGACCRSDGGRRGRVTVLRRHRETRVLLDDLDVLLVSYSFPTDPFRSFPESELQSVSDEDDGI